MKNTYKPNQFLSTLLFFAIVGIIIGTVSKNLALQFFSITFLLIISILLCNDKKKSTRKAKHNPLSNPRNVKPLATNPINILTEQDIESNISISDINSIYEQEHISGVKTHHLQFKVAGTSFRKNEIEDLATDNYEYEYTKKEIIDNMLDGEEIYQYYFNPHNVELIPEPDNQYDQNAIKVIIDNIHVGYIKKGSCSRIKNLINQNKVKKIDADIYGGKYKIVEFDEYKDSYVLERDETEYSVKIDLTVFD